MNRLFLYLLLFCSFSCDRTLGPPKDVLSERRMVALLVDLQVAEAKVKNLKVSVDSAKHVFSIYEVQIFDKHNVTPDKYLHSYRYYLDNHRLMSRVHQAVLDTLMERQRKAESMPAPSLKPQEAKEKLAQQAEALKDSTTVRDSLPPLSSPLPADSAKLRLKERRFRRDRQAPSGTQNSNN